MWIIVWTVQLVLWDTALCDSQPCNDLYKFPCKKGGCTSMSYVCDKYDDCGDMSDQDVCGPHCPKWSYRCANGVGCYSYLKHCDDVFDCSDGSDELNCSPCSESSYRCANKVECYSHLKRCDGLLDCYDHSDELNCPPCSESSYRCANKVECYSYLKRCDGLLDCSDRSDELNCRDCPGMTCPGAHCAAKRDFCCQMRSGTCAVTNVDDLLETMKGDLVYANGRDLYFLSFVNNTKRHLHRQGDIEITALAYRAETSTIFWAAGSKIWSLSSTENEDQAQLFGEIKAPCSIAHMAYDWITGNFYLVCRHSRVLVCGSRSGQTLMLCSKLISVDMKITWFALDPNSGRMFIGGAASSGFELVEAESDGSNARKIYRGELKSKFHFEPKINKILVLKADGYGYLRGINFVDDTEKSIASRFIELNSTAEALLTNMAILRKSDEVYGVFFAQNLTLSRMKTLDIEPTTQLFHLVDPTSQPADENPCDQLECDQLCLLVQGGAVCKCASVYADESGPCELKRNGKVSAQIHLEPSEARHATAKGDHPKPRSDYLAHAMYIVVIVVSITCGAVLCYYLLSRKKYYKAQAFLNRAEPTVTFENKGSSTALYKHDACS